ncbi:aminotransferase class V-fold PLP-dependent enzyme [Idiomarina xiamenensis]|uniref:Probable cysteine desulfurase n=1 Tax=Idiomarina xiamenensis 10-D-4 TaxID=740709 RepID=K2K5H5_9GAMM|nr:aminotransferase class V-fold PLP-dependent enzyme [Idiomarina xiamenensis]EKE82838.1 nitrogenase cofactor synthesis protein NifS2 [Idiomarina xiamenensis 10-D-4]
MLSCREQFSYLTDSDLIYLDNAATSQLPISVLNAQQQYWQYAHANAHRGAHQRARSATEAWERCRQTAATFIGANAADVSLQTSTTQALNHLALMLAEQQPDLRKIVVSAAEHHANWLPWQYLAQRCGAEFVVLPVAVESGEIQQWQQLIDSDTDLVAITHVSNVSGVINPVEEICRHAHKQGARVIVDAAQSAAHLALDVDQLQCDALVFSAHKVYAPVGVAVMYLAADWWPQLTPQIRGGGMVAQVTPFSASWLPDIHRFEAGTPNVAAAVGLTNALQWFAEQAPHQAQVEQSFNWLQQQLAQRPWLQRVAANTSRRIPLLSLYCESIHSQDLAFMLDEAGIAVRAGQHCAQPLLQQLGLSSVVRLSWGLNNRDDDMQRVVDALDQAYQLFIE